MHMTYLLPAQNPSISFSCEADAKTGNHFKLYNKFKIRKIIIIFIFISRFVVAH